MRFGPGSMLVTGPRSAVVLGLGMIAACQPRSGGPANDNTDRPPPDTARWAPAFDATDAGFLSSVWGSGANNVFMVGGQPEAGVVFHYDGAGWSRMEVPAVPILVWVFGFGPDEVLAVGEGGGAIRFDGTRWVTMATGVEADLWGVWGASPEDVWAVGGELAEGPPVILHFDGATWASMPVPPLDRASTALLKVWGTSASQVFAVGQAGVILEFDGGEWQQVPSGTGEDLISLWGNGPEDIVAVGGRANGLAAVYDGTGWVSRSLAPLPGLNGVFMEKADRAVVVGLIGSAASVALDSFEIVAEDTATALTLHAVWGDGSGIMYAVGGRSDELPYRGVALRRSSP